MASYVTDLVRAHPRTLQTDTATEMNDALAACIEASFACAQACTACADACLGEQGRERLVRCIRLCQDCADVCHVTGRLVSRETEPSWSLLRDLLTACVTACRVCGTECAQHAEHMEHCRICAEACARCADACSRLLAVMPRESAAGA